MAESSGEHVPQWYMYDDLEPCRHIIAERATKSTKPKKKKRLSCMADRATNSLYCSLYGYVFMSCYRFLLQVIISQLFVLFLGAAKAGGREQPFTPMVNREMLCSLVRRAFLQSEEQQVQHDQILRHEHGRRSKGEVGEGRWRGERKGRERGREGREGGERGRGEREGREGGERGRGEREGREGGERGRGEREGREGGERGRGEREGREGNMGRVSEGVVQKEEGERERREGNMGRVSEGVMQKEEEGRTKEGEGGSACTCIW